MKRKRRPLHRQNIRWAITIVLWTFAISVTLSLASSHVMDNMNLLMGFLVLLAFIFLGVVFDILGIAVATASEKPFHSMAARKVAGSREALRLIRKAEKVSNFCNDVVGDICGIISGVTGAVIVTRLAAGFSLSTAITQLMLSGLVAGLTVGGKALGKSFAMRKNTNIVFWAGRCLHFFTHGWRGKA